MKTITITENDAGMRVDRFLSRLLPHLPPSLIQRSVRQKKLRLNGRHPAPEDRLAAGDTVTLYLRPELMEPTTPGDSVPSAEGRKAPPIIDIVYEDRHILVADKPAGLLSQDAAAPDSLAARVLAYLYDSGEWRPQNGFKPELCHRIDRNTSGLVIAAKTHDALTVVCEKLRLREIEKHYLCLAHGEIEPPSGTFRDYIFKHTNESRVTVTSHPVRGARTAVTHYRVLGARDGMSLVECGLETGRTHQIRAQLAFHGHPLAGDGKYGRDKGAQRLCAYKLRFAFKTSAGKLGYLNGMTIELPKLPIWAEEWI
ncbi:MAG: RluA family pseudouridine synthase [Oscillospiraceae bacterium]|nr:RluA family pseudouridine synthase [Oscillospiraceae bacterium]